MKPVVLVVLDGLGERKEREANAVRLARTPTFDKLYAEYPHGLLCASGLWLVAARDRFHGVQLDLLTHSDLRLVAGRLQDRLCFGQERLTIPTGRSSNISRVAPLQPVGPSLDHLQRVDGRRHVMHSDPPRSVHRGQRRDHRGGGLPSVRWPERAIGIRKERPEEPLSGGTDQDRDAGGRRRRTESRLGRCARTHCDRSDGPSG